MKKRVGVLFTEPPLGTNKTSEKLRMALGLTLNDDNEVSLVFLGDSRAALAELDEKGANMLPITRHILMISKMKGRLYMESGGSWPVMSGLSPARVGRADVAGILNNANVLLH